MMNTHIGRQFGKLITAYTQGRQTYDKSVFQLLNKYAVPEHTLLDLACGTGIATEQLWKENFPNIHGCDIDTTMLQTAKQRLPQINFINGDSNQLPFAERAFNCITTFAAFHWFCNATALQEIRRILKKDGIFFIVNRHDVGEFREAYHRILENVTGKKLLSAKTAYEPIAALQKCQFSILEEYRLFRTEKYPLDQALQLCKSFSLWNYLSEKQQLAAIPQIEYLLERFTEQRIFLRKIELHCIVAKPV